MPHTKIERQAQTDIIYAIIGISMEPTSFERFRFRIKRPVKDKFTTRSEEFLMPGGVTTRFLR